MAAENLHGSMDMSQCFCLNQAASHPFSNLFVGDETLACRSDCDGRPDSHCLQYANIIYTALINN